MLGSTYSETALTLTSNNLIPARSSLVKQHHKKSQDLGKHVQTMIPSGYLTVCHGIDGPCIDGLPIKNGDFPWLC